jgi:hypothetical protein
MDKQYRKQIEQQLALTIAYFLRKTDEKAAAAMAKNIKSASKDIAKKFVKIKISQADKLNAVKETLDKRVAAKKSAVSKKAVSVKSSTDSIKKEPVKSVAAKKKSTSTARKKKAVTPTKK